MSIIDTGTSTWGLPCRQIRCLHHPSIQYLLGKSGVNDGSKDQEVEDRSIPRAGRNTVKHIKLCSSSRPITLFLHANTLEKSLWNLSQANDKPLHLQLKMLDEDPHHQWSTGHWGSKLDNHGVEFILLGYNWEQELQDRPVTGPSMKA